MMHTYTIVKKNSLAHKKALDSLFIKNKQIVPVGGTHVLIPQIRKVDFGHNVSHAKNRTAHRRLSNVHVMRVSIEGENKAIRVSSRSLRTYKKIATAAVQK